MLIVDKSLVKHLERNGSIKNRRRKTQRYIYIMCRTTPNECLLLDSSTDGHVLLVSPVHPVNEGSSVTLSCKLRRGNFTSTVAFYKNDELIQNGDKEELTIAAVTKSDEGFYKCEHSGEVSPQSWMSVKCE